MHCETCHRSLRRARPVDPRVWNDAAFTGLDAHAQLLFLFVLTHPYLTSLGALRGRLDLLGQELGWPAGQSRRAAAALLECGLLEQDEARPLISLPNYFQENPPQSPADIAAWKADLNLHPEGTGLRRVLSRAWQAARAAGDECSKEFVARFDVTDLDETPPPRPRPVRVDAAETPQDRTIPKAPRANGNRKDGRAAVARNGKSPRQQAAARTTRAAQAGRLGEGAVASDSARDAAEAGSFGHGALRLPAGIPDFSNMPEFDARLPALSAAAYDAAEAKFQEHLKSSSDPGLIKCSVVAIAEPVPPEFAGPDGHVPFLRQILDRDKSDKRFRNVTIKMDVTTPLPPRLAWKDFKETIAQIDPKLARSLGRKPR